MTIVSCVGRFHAFALAEQLEKHHLLSGFYTSYAYQKNTLLRRFVSRMDKEDIPAEKIHTAIPIAAMMKMKVPPFIINKYYEQWVYRSLANKSSDYNTFIGWSGMSLAAIREANKKGKMTILERGSSHIQFQDQILHQEYKKFGIDFRIDPRTVEKELMEYEEADYISVPSTFVKNSFLEYDFPAHKLIQNAYGSSSHFNRVSNDFPKNKFRILYLGTLTIQKGLIYLFEALHKLNIPVDNFEAWFIGKVDEEMKATVEKHARPNWKFFGHLNYYDLPKYISACQVAVQPSVQEGLSMVIPQMISCGVPVIATTNTGGEDVIEENKTGFIVPAKNPEMITDKIQMLFDDPGQLEEMQQYIKKNDVTKNLSWDNYGNRYVNFIQRATT